MTAPSRDLAPETLLADHAWVRRLARRLTRDPELADELAQETWVRALESERRAGWPLRAWLGGVLRNLARQGQRERARREARERTAARPEALPGAAEALERIAVQQEVVRAVLALDEPYRSTVVLRFHDGLPPRRIAARLGVPVETVKTRLQRALAQLRTRLDREHGGDGRSWALFLLPLARRPAGAGPFVAGALAVSTLVKLSLAAAAAAGLVLWLATRENAPRAVPAEPADARVLPELTTPRLDREEHVEASPAREEIAAEPLEEKSLAEGAQVKPIRGRVIDATGAPVAGVELGLRRSRGVYIDEDGGAIMWDEDLRTDLPPLAISDAEGRFLLDPESSGVIVSQDERWETVLAPNARARPGLEQVLVIAPRLRLTGLVHDSAGDPLAQVNVRFVLPKELVRRFDVDLGTTKAGYWVATTDEHGRFALDRLPAVAGAHLRARLAPYEDEVIERSDWSDDELDIELSEPAGGWLEGVVEADGRRLPGATVALGYRATTTDEGGRFRVSLSGIERAEELLALAHGFLPARIRGDRNDDGSIRWPSFMRLTLSGKALSLAGTVLDPGGDPLAGQEVWIADGTISHTQEAGFPFLLESVLAGKPEMRVGAKTDERGRFQISGLEERDYRLQVIDPRTALVLEAGPFPAGIEDVVVRQPAGALWPVARGVVRSKGGTPLAGLHVQVQRDAGAVGVPGKVYFGFIAYGAGTKTDEQGMFELQDVPREGVFVHVSGGQVVDPELELTPTMDPLALQVVVSTPVSLQVHVGSAYPGADAFGVLDAQGRGVLIVIPNPAGISRLYEQALVEGRSPVVSTSDDATILVLYRGQDELARVPITLHATGINTIDL